MYYYCESESIKCSYKLKLNVIKGALWRTRSVQQKRVLQLFQFIHPMSD